MARGAVGRSGVGRKQAARVLSFGRRAGRKLPESGAIRSEMVLPVGVGVADAQTGLLHDIQILAGCRLGHALPYFHVKCLLVCTGLLSAVLLILALSTVCVSYARVCDWLLWRVRSRGRNHGMMLALSLSSASNCCAPMRFDCFAISFGPFC